MVDAVLVLPLLVLVAAAVIQVAVVVHVRAALVSAATEGARASALSGASAGAAERRVQSLVAGTIAGATVRDVDTRTATLDGLPVVEVRIEATLPLLGLLGPAVLEVDGHALREGWS